MPGNDSFPAEEWRPIPGWEGEYDVSDHGRVRSWKRSGPPRVLRPGFSYGYPYYNLHRVGRKQFVRRVHVLVMLAFVGERPEGLQIRHLDGDPANPHLSNLKYGTRYENHADSVRHGTAHRGERHVWAKLTAADVLNIRARHAAGESQADLARNLQLPRTTISTIVLRNCWRHI